MMSRLALRDYEQEVRIWNMDPIDRIILRFVSGVTKPLFQIKSIMWTIMSTYMRMNLESRWEEARIEARVDAGVLGYGSVTFVKSNGAMMVNTTTTTTTTTLDDGDDGQGPPPSSITALSTVPLNVTVSPQSSAIPSSNSNSTNSPNDIP